MTMGGDSTYHPEDFCSRHLRSVEPRTYWGLPTSPVSTVAAWRRGWLRHRIITINMDSDTREFEIAMLWK